MFVKDLLDTFKGDINGDIRIRIRVANPDMSRPLSDSPSYDYTDTEKAIDECGKFTVEYWFIGHDRIFIKAEKR